MKLVIEVNGSQHAELQTQDNGRTAWLRVQGWSILRFWNNGVLQNIEGVLEEIYNVLSKNQEEVRLPHPGPPPEMGRE